MSHTSAPSKCPSGKFEDLVEKALGAAGDSLIFKEIAVTETLIHRAKNVFRGQAVAKIGDERNIRLAGAGQVQDREGLVGAAGI